VSEFVQKSMQLFLPKENVHFIKDIIDIDDVIEKSKCSQDYPFDSSKFNIVSVGRLAKQKAFDLSITAAAHLKEKGCDFHWYILGEGGERKNLESLITKLNLKNHVTLLGFIVNPYPYIKNTNIYCQTSLLEGLGRVLIEANHLNKVTVATDFPSAYSLIEPEFNGCIVPMKSELIADKISMMINDLDYLSNIEKNLINNDLNTKAETIESFDNLMNIKNEN
jgi:glycosyltransferase involved in cell wall biosynthesis